MDNEKQIKELLQASIDQHRKQIAENEERIAQLQESNARHFAVIRKTEDKLSGFTS